ncbi:DUF4256 domain-containing protein [Mycoplasmopsis gallinarum]
MNKDVYKDKLQKIYQKSLDFFSLPDDFISIYQKLSEKSNYEIISKWISNNDNLILAYFNDSYLLVDNFKEQLPSRVNVCYDLEARKSRKQYPPQNSAYEIANDLNLDLLDKDEYLFLQSKLDWDNKTSSWLKTPLDFRQNKFAYFGDKKFGHTFIYHNGVQSYYATRGFRLKFVFKLK